jgi:hypothetical protein
MTGPVTNPRGDDSRAAAPNTPKPSAPKDWRAWLFFYVQAAYSKLPPLVRHVLEAVIVKVAPNVPDSVTSVFRDAAYGRAIMGGYVVTFALCFGVTAIWSAVEGTWSGSDPNRMYLSRDLTDMLNFSIVCPLYVGFGCALITACVRGWGQLRELEGSPTHAELALPRWNSKSLGLPAIAFIVLLAAGLFTANFMNETLNPAIYPKAFWYVSGIAVNSERHIGALGVYYTLLMFSLLAFSLFALAFVFAGFLAGIRIGDAIERDGTRRPVSVEELRIRLSTFTQIYILTKLLAAAYMANALTWKWEHPVRSVNFNLLGVLLTAFGIYFISIPRYYIELQWYEAKVKYSDLTSNVSEEYDDIRPWTVRNIAGVVDTLIIGGFFVTFWL